MKRTKKSIVFVQRCMNYHRESNHSGIMQHDCMTCHIPLTACRSLDFNSRSGKDTLFYKLKTHRIAIYKNLGYNF